MYKIERVRHKCAWDIKTAKLNKCIQKFCQSNTVICNSAINLLVKKVALLSRKFHNAS